MKIDGWDIVFVGGTVAVAAGLWMILPAGALVFVGGIGMFVAVMKWKNDGGLNRRRKP